MNLHFPIATRARCALVSWVLFFDVVDKLTAYHLRHFVILRKVALDVEREMPVASGAPVALPWIPD
jgi:hypothetical protein